MKLINNLSAMLIAVVATTFIGCVGSDFEGTEYPLNSYRVEGTAYSVLGFAGDFDIGKVDVKSVSYTINVKGDIPAKIEAVITHPNGATGLLNTSTTFPDTKTVSLSDALAATGLSQNDVAVADLWTVEFLTGGVSTGKTIKINTVTTFKSALAGEMTGTATVTAQGGAAAGWDGVAGASWTGPVTFARQQLLPNEDGEYIIFTKNGANDALEDISFGAYYVGYGTDAQSNLPNGDLRLRDVDNTLSITGSSQWGEVYSISNVVTDGSKLSFNWTNDYGEGAFIELVRNDGENWPDLN